MLRARTRRDEGGFTLVEVLAASVVLIVGLTATLALINAANRTTMENRDREAANNLARQITETAKRVPYIAVTPTGILSTLQSQAGLADADTIAPGWQLKAVGDDRRNQTFTITADVCSVDDPKDGIGSHTGGTYCSAAGATSPADTTPEDYKRLTVNVTPPTGSSIGPMKMSSFIANTRDGTSSTGGGGSSGVGEGYAILMDPLCTGCNANAWTNLGQVAPCRTFTTTVGTNNCNPTYNGAAQANYSGNQIGGIPIKAIFPVNAASVKFFLYNWPAWYQTPIQGSPYPSAEFLGNGTQDPQSARVWTYTWDLADTYPNQTPDGFYNVKAIAYDANGVQIGNHLMMSFWLNRFIPDLGFYQSPVAGRDQLHCVSTPPCASSGKVEIEWQPKTPAGRNDWDIQNWRVYRNGTLLACTKSNGALRTGFNFFPYYGNAQGPCIDTASPAVPTTGTVTYTLRATSWSPDGLAQTEGGNVQPASANVNVTNGRPVTPTGFSVAYRYDQGYQQLEFGWNSISGSGDSSPAGDCATSIRVYRTTTSVAAGSVTTAHRAYRTSSLTATCSAPGITTWRTPRAVPGGLGIGLSGATTRWWVATVDKTNNESVLSAPFNLVNQAP